MSARTSHEAIQSSRLELKYSVDEETACAIRDYLGARLLPDPNCVNGPYAVCSVYLDSADDLLYRQTLQGIRNRYKLRVRIYDDDPSHPAFLEIKSREGNAVKKQRAKVDRSLAATLLSGGDVSYQPPSGSGGQATADHFTSFQEFCRYRDRIGAIGTTYVYYRREAYVSPQNASWRATFDRQLVASPYLSGTRLGLPQQVVSAGAGKTVVFELKFTNRFPHWMQELVRTFNLVAGPFPKYLTCRDSIRTGGVGGADAGQKSVNGSRNSSGVERLAKPIVSEDIAAQTNTLR